MLNSNTTDLTRLYLDMDMDVFLSQLSHVKLEIKCLQVKDEKEEGVGHVAVFELY